MLSHWVDQWEPEHRAQVAVFGGSRGRLLTSSQRLLLVFFLLLVFCRLIPVPRMQPCKSHRRWLATPPWLASHPEVARELGFSRLPQRTTLARR